MAQVIDTSVVIGMERHGHTLQDLAALSPDEPIALASITASELLVGVYRADTPEALVGAGPRGVIAVLMPI